ncbi:hypothetical protein [Exiguobacterium oxidotolerans]|uniref:hypothetical protein n=1 Tax=Exiguobacterium oxidotolerans TaxID=223958 RepID=UPI000493E699|nr:hypothetical protein [Exiguobacterium oxidotolerans]
MNMFSLVQRKIKTDESVKGEIITMRVRPDMYFNFTNIKTSGNDDSKPKTTHDFQRALSKALQAFDDVMEKEMGD